MITGFERSVDQITEFDLARSFRVVIFVSGETRNFGYSENSQLKEFKELLESMGHTVILYGHTWDHCSLDGVKETGLQFKKLAQENQENIVSWVKEDIFLRAPLKNQQPPKNFHDPTFEEYYFKHAKPTYGQIWSAFNCYNMLENEDLGADIFIRWRWDLGHLQRRINEYTMQQLKYILIKCATNINPIGVITNNNTIFPGYSGPGTGMQFTGTLEDTIMMYNKSAIVRIKHEKITKMLDNILEKQMKKSEVPDAHTLWYEVLFKHFDFCYSTELPNLFAITRDT